MNNNFCKSTLVASGYTQTLAANDTASFTTSVKTTGSSIVMGADNKTINLKSAGLYQINLSAIATGDVDATAVSLQINRDGIALTTGLASFTPATAEGNTENIAVSTIVEVDKTCCGQGKSAIPITVTNTGGDAIYTAIIISVIKIA